MEEIDAIFTGCILSTPFDFSKEWKLGRGTCRRRLYVPFPYQGVDQEDFASPDKVYIFGDTTDLGTIDGMIFSEEVEIEKHESPSYSEWAMFIVRCTNLNTVQFDDVAVMLLPDGRAATPEDMERVEFAARCGELAKG